MPLTTEKQIDALKRLFESLNLTDKQMKQCLQKVVFLLWHEADTREREDHWQKVNILLGSPKIT